ncbi:peptidase C11 clostripain [Spirochaeta thermophila DSM 6578]|uniref:Peptidase C11 clostripain n=1 Tax=Winmispira thermophila (strain ATCC 700085 / DSM 6578 / Z-1203) TaxID=869211 RepID=G0GA56_WINT7|nr:clostripain-related cysteine peptidase [Spirochaeta thermophila]AEJ60892.1 peptidase C11 clostripain [Spirochaeta thermophila DSM 6578]
MKRVFMAWLSVSALLLLVLTGCPIPTGSEDEGGGGTDVFFTVTVDNNAPNRGVVVDQEGFTFQGESSSKKYKEGTQVTLTAIPTNNYKFSYWSYSGSIKTEETLTFTVTKDVSIGVVFTLRNLTLEVEPEGAGTILKDPDKEDYKDGENVELTADPATGYLFNYWEFSDGSISNDNPLQYEVGRLETVVAHFVNEQSPGYTLTIEEATGGTVSVDLKKNYYQSGETVTLTAHPEENSRYLLEKWIVTVGGTSQEFQDNPLQITFSSSDITVEPVFEEGVTLSVSVNPSNGGSVNVSPQAPGEYDGAALYLPGSQVTLTAVESTFYLFTGWTGDYASTDAEIQIELTGDMSLTAVFERGVSVSLTTEGSGTISYDPAPQKEADGKLIYQQGTQVAFTAIPSQGWVFKEWDISNLQNVPSDLTQSQIEVSMEPIDSTSTVEITAHFLKECTISVAPEDVSYVTIDPSTGPYYTGDSITVTVTPPSGQMLDSWIALPTWVPEEYAGYTSFTVTLEDDLTLDPEFVQRDWLIMVYMAGDNDLEPNAIADFNEMEEVDRTGSGVEIVVLFDRASGYDYSNGSWTSTRAYRVVKDPNGADSTIVSERISLPTLGITPTSSVERNMGDPDTISGFIQDAMSAYPAAHYALIFWNHGGGWRSLSTRSLPGSLSTLPVRERHDTKVICLDEYSGDYLYTQEIGAGLAAGLGSQTLDVVGFDLCLGGMAEIMYEVASYADYFIGSEDLEPGDGWEYSLWIPDFITNGKTAQAFCQAVVDAYSQHYAGESWVTLAAVDLDAFMNSVIPAFYDLAGLVDEAITDATTQQAVATAITPLFASPQGSDGTYEYVDFHADLGQFAQAMLSVFAGNTQIETAATILANAVSSAVVAEWHSSDYQAQLGAEPGGISMYYMMGVYDASTGDLLTVTHSSAYVRGSGVSYPLSFVEDTSNTWVIDSHGTPDNYDDDTGLLNTLFYVQF